MVNKVKKVSATLFEFKKPTSVSAELLRAHKHPVRNFNYSDMNYKLKLSLFQQVHSKAMMWGDTDKEERRRGG